MGLLIAVVAGALPGQSGLPERRPAPPSAGDALPPFEVGPGNWPIPREGLDAPSRPTPPRSDFATRALEHWPLPPAPAGEVDRGLRLDSPLRDVFKAVRQPADLAALGGVTVGLRLTLYDHLGEELGTREITHEADLEHPDRDRLLFSDGRVYGRSGQTVFARQHRRPWPTLYEEARGELEWFGALLRAPWIFSDVRRYRVLPADDTTWRGNDVVRVRIERRPPRAQPQREGVPVDRFELICEPDTFAPRELVIRLAATGAMRRVLLDDFRELGSVRFPMRRTILVEGDRVAMVMRITRIETGQRFTEQHFRPHVP